MIIIIVEKIIKMDRNKKEQQEDNCVSALNITFAADNINESKTHNLFNK